MFRKLKKIYLHLPTFERSILTLLAVVLIATLSVVGYRHFTRQDLNSASVIANKVGKLTSLPSGETPLLSTVEDKTIVSQPFLANAENGDKVLIYGKARKVYVYRPRTNKIINIGPILTTLVPVFVRSGSPSANVDAALNEIKTQSVNFSVISRDESPKKDYKQTLVVDLTGARTSAAEQLASLLHGSVAALPSGESRPDADLLVIVGSDQQ